MQDLPNNPCLLWPRETVERRCSSFKGIVFSRRRADRPLCLGYIFLL